jgi:hypothetical protein
MFLRRRRCGASTALANPSLSTLRKEHREKRLNHSTFFAEYFAMRYHQSGGLTVVNVRYFIRLKLKNPPILAGCVFQANLRLLQTRLLLVKGKDINAVGNNPKIAHTMLEIVARQVNMSTSKYGMIVNRYDN